MSRSAQGAALLALAAATGTGADVVMREALVAGPLGRAVRFPVHTDPVEARIVEGTWSAPRAGEAVGGTDLTWQAVPSDDGGRLEGLPALRAGYVSWTVRLPVEAVLILEARGHSMVYVNQRPRAGDPYGYGFVRLPVSLHAGDNELLFRVDRGGLAARLVEPRGGIYLDPGDVTLPDLVAGETGAHDAAIVAVNATAHAAKNLVIEASLDGRPGRRARVPVIPPMSLRKVGFRFGGVADAAGSADLRVSLVGRGGALDEATVRPAVREPGQRFARTFVSAVDGSVQYYAVTPRAGGEGAPALYLTLHGAGVEARRQASVYRPRADGIIVAPTNRRPFGFDWEDWGRLDALEVLDDVLRRDAVNPRRVYLTGHSMGGHGVWHLGATYPDRFAALGPSAAWVSFASYTGVGEFEGGGAVADILRRAAAPSDTAALSRNYLHHGIYILHGEQDDNVPVGQARSMKNLLDGFHPDLAYHEEPGAGHWWGDRCCDWPPMFDFLARHARPAPGTVDHVEFVTASPGISARCDWVTIELQRRMLAPARVVADLDRRQRRFDVTTDNVAAMSLDVSGLDDPPGAVDVFIDGQGLRGQTAAAPTGRVHLARVGASGAWHTAAAPPPSRKGPHRYGCFKDAFRRGVVFVYGTTGTDDENAWAFVKARFDAETFWYRGNGSIDVVPDRDFDPAARRDRNVVLYGNADTNAAWQALLAASPVQVRRGAVRVGDDVIGGDDLACLLIRPRPESDVASVAAVAGSGLPGMRLTDRLPYFVSGVHYPDWIVMDPGVLQHGLAGVRTAGFFDGEWRIP